MKLFAVSDIHSYYNEFIEALNNSGFENGNPNQLLVVCGDCFDRGDQSLEVLECLQDLPNKILIRGNHEDLAEELARRCCPMSHDWSNGTCKTFMQLDPYGKNWDAVCPVAMEKLKPLFDQMVDYYETEKYIFVHAWLPRNWKIAHNSQWKKSRWNNPFDCAAFGYNKTGKIIVHGHYHNSYWWSQNGVGSEWDDDACFDICEHDGCIGLDACTALSGKVNVLVIEDRLLEEVIK